MLTKNRQGAVNIVIRNADDDNIIGEKQYQQELNQDYLKYLIMLRI